MEMLFLSFAGSMLAYFAFLSASSSAASAQAASATNWPPTAAQQQALQAQISQLVAEVTGRALTAQQQANLTQLLAVAPSQYQATLPSGAQPTTGGYTAWVLSGSAAQAAAQATGPTGLPVGPSAPNWGLSSSAGGPLGVRGGNPNPVWDVYGNAYFTDSRGFPVGVYHATYPWADYSVPVHMTDFVGLQHQQEE